MEEQQNGDAPVIEPVRLKRDQCANCGTTEFLAYRMVVPKDVGGKDVKTNYVLLCRACEFASTLGDRKEPCRAVNVYLSRGLFEAVMNTIAVRNGHTSMSGLARYLVASYLKDPERYEDIRHFQDKGTDVRANLWLHDKVYKRFKIVVYEQNSTVTETLKGLLYMYTQNMDPKKECGE